MGSAFETRLSLETGIDAGTAFTLLERKGAGHPDTLADHLAEELSRVYSRWTLEHCGAVLHHNSGNRVKLVRDVMGWRLVIPPHHVCWIDTSIASRI